MFVAQARHLLGLEAPVQRLLHVDHAQLAGQAVKRIGFAVAVLDAGGQVFVGLVEIAADEYQQAAVVGLPVLLAAVAEAAQALLDLVGRPGHDLHQRHIQLQVALQLLGLPAAQLEAQLGIASLGPFGVERGLGHRRFDVTQQGQRRRKPAVGQQRPDVLVALDAQFAALVVDGAEALELVQHQDAGLAFTHAGLGQHAGNALRPAPARAVGEAVHLHFDEAVVEAQELRQAAHELGLAGAGQPPQADDDRADHQLGHDVPRPHRIDDALDDGVDAEQLALQLGGNGLQLLVALRQLRAQFIGIIHSSSLFAAAPAAPRGRHGAGRRGGRGSGAVHSWRFPKSKRPGRSAAGHCWPRGPNAVSTGRHGSAGAQEPCSVDHRNEQGGHRWDLRGAGAVVSAFGNRARMMRASHGVRKGNWPAALWPTNGAHAASRCWAWNHGALRVAPRPRPVAPASATLPARHQGPRVGPHAASLAG